MYSKLITSILNEPLLSQGNAPANEAYEFQGEEAIQGEEEAYPYHQDNQNESIEEKEAYSVGYDGELINSPFKMVDPETDRNGDADYYTSDAADKEEEKEAYADRNSEQLTATEMKWSDEWQTSEYDKDQETVSYISELEMAEAMENQVAVVKPAPGVIDCEGYACWAKSVLNNLLGSGLAINNRLDEPAKKAIGDFQLKNNLPQTQKIDAPTERALLEKEALRRHAETAFKTASEKTIAEAKTKIEDWTKQAVNNKPQHILNSYRDPRKVYAFVLHQMAFKRKGRKTGQYSDPTSYLSTGAHFCIMLDGRIIQLHPMCRMIWHGNCVSPRSVAVEFEGNFPNVKGDWWVDKASQFQNKDHPTQAQFDSGRFLASYLKVVLGTTHILAHRQSSDSRENDPGPDIWYNVGQWAVEKLGLSDGGPNFKCGDGNPILPEWRTWGTKTIQPELEAYSESNTHEWEENFEGAKDAYEPEAEEETRSYAQTSWKFGSAYLTLTAEKQGQIKGGVTQKGKEGAISVYKLHHEIISPRDPASGQATGKRVHKPLSITKEIDTASVKLLQALATNEKLKEVVINFWKPDGTSGVEINYYRIKLINASVANISHDLPNALDPSEMKLPVFEKIEFVYQKIEWSYLVKAPSSAADDWSASNELEFPEAIGETEWEEGLESRV